MRQGKNTTNHKCDKAIAKSRKNKHNKKDKQCEVMLLKKVT